MSATAIAIDIDGYEIRGWTPADSRLPLVHSAVKRLVQEAGGPVDPDRECIAHWLSETICRTSVRTVGRILHRLVENGDQVARRIDRRYYFDLPKQQRELFPATVGIAAISAPPRSRRGRSAASQMTAQPQAQATVEMPATIAPDAASDTARDTRQMHGEMHSGAPPRVPSPTPEAPASAQKESGPSRITTSEKSRPAEVVLPDYTTPETGQVQSGEPRVTKHRYASPCPNCQDGMGDEFCDNKATGSCNSFGYRAGAVPKCQRHKAKLDKSRWPSALALPGDFYYCPSHVGGMCSMLWSSERGVIRDAGHPAGQLKPRALAEAFESAGRPA